MPKGFYVVRRFESGLWLLCTFPSAKELFLPFEAGEQKALWFENLEEALQRAKNIMDGCVLIVP